MRRGLYGTDFIYRMAKLCIVARFTFLSALFDQACFSLAFWHCIMVNWRTYNESLVRRGEVMLDFDVIDG
jgi:hypothetical protein